MSNRKKYKVKGLLRKRGVTMPPAIATIETKFRGKKKPDIAATASLKRDKLAISKIEKGRREARTGKTYSWDDVFGD